MAVDLDPKCCRFCSHTLASHSLQHGCTQCRCLATPGEGAPKGDEFEYPKPVGDNEPLYNTEASKRRHAPKVVPATKAQIRMEVRASDNDIAALAIELAKKIRYNERMRIVLDGME